MSVNGSLNTCVLLFVVHGRELDAMDEAGEEDTNKQTKTNCVSSPASSIARKSEAVMGLTPLFLHHPHWIFRRPKAVPGVLLRLPRTALNKSKFE